MCVECVKSFWSLLVWWHWRQRAEFCLGFARKAKISFAAEAAFAALTGDDESDGALAGYDRAVRSSFIWSDLRQVREMRSVFGRGLFLGGALASAMTVTKGRFNPGAKGSEPDDSQLLTTSDRASGYHAPDGKLSFDKLSSVFSSGNKTRDDQPNHIKIRERVPPELARMWVHLCPAHVYSAGPTDPQGLCTVEIAASNCVQCGAISARGGRLTPPEGGSGPEYTLT